jgi:hypothetical protein
MSLKEKYEGNPMKVRVHVHESPTVEEQFRVWRRTLPGTRGDQTRWGVFIWKRLGDLLRTALRPSQ